MQKVDSEIRRIIDEQYTVARDIIEKNSDKMHTMAKALLEWETIDAQQIDDIAQGKTPKPPKDTLKSGPENDGGNSSDSGGGSSTKSGTGAPPDAATATN